MKCCLSCSDESCDFVMSFLQPVGEKNVTTGQNVEVADAHGTLPKAFFHTSKGANKEAWMSAWWSKFVNLVSEVGKTKLLPPGWIDNFWRKFTLCQWKSHYFSPVEKVYIVLMGI